MRTCRMMCCTSLFCRTGITLSGAALTVTDSSLLPATSVSLELL